MSWITGTCLKQIRSLEISGGDAKTSGGQAENVQSSRWFLNTCMAISVKNATLEEKTPGSTLHQRRDILQEVSLPASMF